MNLTSKPTKRSLCAICGASGLFLGAVGLMLEPAVWPGNDAGDHMRLVAAHQSACKDLNGPQADEQELDSCLQLLLTMQSPPVEVFVERGAGRT